MGALLGCQRVDRHLRGVGGQPGGARPLRLHRRARDQAGPGAVGRERDVTRLESLYAEQGQSPWLDNLRRDWLSNGHLADLVRHGVRGVTSNPTIFAKAIAGED